MRMFAPPAFVVLTWLGLLLVPTPASAQATIAGTVKDTSGAVLPGVSVEVASAVLIEKVRSAVTDGSGQYRIIDLRPGTYTLTFTLSGFSIVKREGIELTGVMTATVNIDLRIGALSETIIVSGETPVVDVQSIRRQATVSGDVLNSLPTARGYAAIMTLIPAIILQPGLSNRDVQVTPGMSVFGGSGGRDSEGRLQVDGINVGASLNGAGVSGYIADVTNATEVSFTTSGGLGEAEVGGPSLSVVPRTGGNTIKGTLFGAVVSSGMVGSNYTQALKDAGLTAAGKLLKLWDFSAAAGGPIFKDRLWYFAGTRQEGSHRSVPGMYANLNAGDPARWTYVPDLTRQSRSAGSWQIMNLRLTLQASARNKFNVFWDEQLPCSGATWSAKDEGCRQQPTSGFIYGGTATSAPETSSYTGSGRFQRVQQASWSSPATNRLLLEAGFGTYLSRYGGSLLPGSPAKSLIQVSEQCTAGCAANGNIPGLTYRSQNPVDSWIGAHTWRAAASYVTGAHSMKFGYQGAFHVWDTTTDTNDSFLSYRVNNGIPNQLTETLNPFTRRDRVRYDALYAQDSWTYNRLTLQGAVRYDHAWSYYPEETVGPTRFLNPGLVFPATDGVKGYQDVTPRVGAAYDVFGNGKTAVKVNAGRYLEAAAVLGIYSSPNPVLRVSASTTRTWTDANNNFEVDCSLENPQANDRRPSGGDFCGQLANLSFGQPVFTNNIDPATLEGWGVRSADWGIGASVQHEILPRVSLEVGYTRRWLQGFNVNDNVLVTASNFDPFSVTAPADPRLPGGGGYVVSGLYNVTPTLSGQTSNLLTRAGVGTYAEQSQRYNGVLVNVSARPRNGLTLQGGFNTGSTITDNCAIRAQLIEIGPTNPYCHNAPGLVTRVTGLGSYTIPKIDVLFSGTFRSDQGGPLSANYAVPNAAVVPSLGRSLSGNATNVTVNLLAPGEMWGDRINEFDIRIAKILRFGRTRTNVGFDLYNVGNTNPVIAYNEAFVPGGSWLAPTAVLSPRFAKFSVSFDF